MHFSKFFAHFLHFWILQNCAKTVRFFADFFAPSTPQYGCCESFFIAMPTLYLNSKCLKFAIKMLWRFHSLMPFHAILLSKFASVTLNAHERKPLTDVQTNSHCNQKILTVTGYNLPDRLQPTGTSGPND